MDAVVTEPDELIAQQFESYMPAITSGYIRAMTAEDVVAGSSAKPGWHAYFDGDGDLVFWCEDAAEVARMAKHDGFAVYQRH